MEEELREMQAPRNGVPNWIAATLIGLVKGENVAGKPYRNDGKNLWCPVKIFPEAMDQSIDMEKPTRMVQ